MRRMLAAAIAVTTMTTLASAAGDVAFVYKFEPGKSQKYRLQINTDMEMTGMQASQVADMMVTVACVSRKADAYAMTLTFDKVDASNTIGGNMATDPTAIKMVGKSVGFTVD